MNTSEKLYSLRRLLHEVGAKAIYVGTTDPHQTESVSAHWKAVQWLTGFTGSMGYAVVTQDCAEFWTDATQHRPAAKSNPVLSISTRFPNPEHRTGMSG